MPPSTREARPVATNDKAGSVSAGDLDHSILSDLGQPMPPLSAEQYAALKDDISTNGVIVPVVVDQHGRILDGNNRRRIAHELGIDCPTVVQLVADDNEALDMAVTLNCARRHLTREQVREVIAHEIQRRPEDSDRAIARRVGCSPSTVGAVRRPEVSNLDSPVMSRDAAERLTKEIQAALLDAREHLMAATCMAFTNKISTAEIVMALTAAQRRFELSHSDTAEVFRLAVFTPAIDAAMSPGNYEYFRPGWDHSSFKPLTDQERSEVLEEIASIGGDS